MKVISPRQMVASEPLFFLFLAVALICIADQLALGTPVYFSVGVLATFFVVILTLRRIGTTSIAGILILFQFFCQIGYSQIAKALSNEPSQSNLQAPETTIAIIFLGTTSLCVAAVITHKILKNHVVISLNPSVKELGYVRNITFPLGVFFLLISWAWGANDNGERDYGGLVGISNQYSYIVYLAILAETWRVLKVTQGQESVSRALLLMLGLLVIRGFLVNGKLPTVAPILMYFIASISYRGYATRIQRWAMALSVVVGIVIVYPVIQVSRAMTTATGLSLDAAGDFLSRMVESPESIVEDFQAMHGDLEGSEFQVGLNYLGRVDDLETRFVMISTTDMIAHAVEKEGPYGWGLITEGFESAMPTFLYADKPRIDTGDELVWHYYLRPWGDPAYPTIGYFGDSFAALGWIGVIIVPFLCGLIFLFEAQLGGISVGGNFIGVYILLKDLFFFGEGGNIAWFVIETIRNIPLDIAAIFAIFYGAALLARRQTAAP